MDYLDFLFEIPLWKRVERVETGLALAAARTLKQLAAGSGSSEVPELACRLWILPLREEWADEIAPPRDVRRVLEKLSPGRALPEDHCRVAIELLDGFRPKRLPDPPEHVVYWGPDGSIAVPTDKSIEDYRRAQGALPKVKRIKSNYPQDDLSLRLADAYWTLREAGCKTAVAELARVLSAKRVNGREWAPNVIRKRLGARIAEPIRSIGFGYRQAYSVSLKGLNRGTSQPERSNALSLQNVSGLEPPIEFVRKRPVRRKRARSRHRVTRSKGS